MIHFITISSYNIGNNELTKDVGMIPYLLHKNYGFDSTIVTGKKGDYTYLGKEVRGLKIDFIKCNLRIPHVVGLSHLWYVLRRAKQINVLNLYGTRPDTVVLARVYKLFNKKGCVYLKLDMRIDNFVNFFQNTSGFFKKIKVAFFAKAYASRCFDLISYEINPRYNELEMYPVKVFKEKMFYLPNGYYAPNTNMQELTEKMYAKKNVILVLGRIGNPYKNHDRLLKLLPQLKFKNWCIKFVGSIEPYFEELITNFFTDNPELKNKVIFTGTVSDKNQLQEEYLSSAVYLLTSKEESYNIALIEALNAGCYVVSTDVGVAFNAIQNDPEIGEIITLDNLSEKIQNIIDGKFDDRLFAKGNISKRHDRALAFSWETNIPRLYQRILEIQNNFTQIISNKY
jgi:glycosyltransferase involved in cell wall biosynthesis